MDKLYYFNPNVGSGVEETGNVFENWLTKLNFKLTVSKNQSYAVNHFEDLIKNNPDIIVINDAFPNILKAVYYYRLTKPNTKILLLMHTWQILYDKNRLKEISEENYTFNKFMEVVDKILILNYKSFGSLPTNLNGRVVNGYHPINSLVYRPKVSWKNRKKLFCYVGNILPHKMSLEFIKQIQDTDLVVDCYGKLDNVNINLIEYTREFELCSENLKYQCVLNQEKVSDYLCQYKYFILPHDGFEPFNMVLLQAILCGTIPLVVNDRKTKLFDYRWIDWAKNLYFGCNTVPELLGNMKNIVIEQPNWEEVSMKMVKRGREKFNHTSLSETFKGILDEFNS